MTEVPREPLPSIPYARPGQIEQYVSRIAFLADMLQPDGRGDTGAILLPADHDGDERPETLELVLTERQVWRIYRDEELLPKREAFLEETPSGQVISRHLLVLKHLGEWSNTVRGIEHLIPLDVQPEADAPSVAMWASENLDLDIENAYRAAAFTDASVEAEAVVAEATAKIESAYRELHDVILILMAVPELQMGREEQTLHVEDEDEGLWSVKTIMGDGRLRLIHTDRMTLYPKYRVVSIEDLLAWNDLHFVPDQASGVHDTPEESLKA